VILRTGIDIVDIRRIEKILKKYGDRFKNKCFLKSEINRFEKMQNNIQSYAKTFAAKEACSKALGTGLSQGIYWKDIELKNNKHGKPYLILHNKAAKLLNAKKLTNTKIEVSISDEKNYAISNVIIFNYEK